MATALSWDIPHLQFKVEVMKDSKYRYVENGIRLQLVFRDYFGDVPQCTIASDTDEPLVGGNNLVFNSTTTREFGSNLMFEPIPLEMLYHDAEKPQVLVKVNGIQGVCPEFNCDYLYTAPTGEITGQTLANGNELTIVGTSLPTDTT